MTKWADGSGMVVGSSTHADEIRQRLLGNSKLNSLVINREEFSSRNHFVVFFTFECANNIASGFGLSMINGVPQSTTIDLLGCQRLVVYGIQEEDGVEEQILFDEPSHLIYKARNTYIKPN